MKRAFLKSPLSSYPAGIFILLIFSLTGAKTPAPGEITHQEGLYYRTEGLQFQKTGELQRAVASFKRALYVKPDYAEVYNDLGVVLESLGELEDAEEAYQTALRFKPDFGAAHSNLALLYEESDRVKKAAVHWGARLRLGPPDDPWVAAAREKLTQYNLPVPETEEDKAEKKNKEIRGVVGTGKAHMEAGRWDKAIESFEQALKVDPRNAEALRLLRAARTRAAQAQGREARELEAAKGRVVREAGQARREEQARKAELEREKAAQAKQLKAAKSRVVKETVSKKQTARQLKELEEARREADEAERRAQKAEQQRQLEAAKRIEAESRAEKVEQNAAADRKLQESEGARRQVVVKPIEPSTAPSDAQALARDIVRERSRVRGRASDDLYRRAAVATREGLYQDAIEIYKQILILEPDNRNAKQGLERAQKALAKQL